MSGQTKALRSITQIRRLQDDEPDEHPLDWKLIVRLFGYTRPHARIRNILFLLTFLRGLQTIALPMTLAWIINGPITQPQKYGGMRGVLMGTAVFAGLAIFTQVTFVYRMRLGQQLGELVVHDLRRDIFAHLQRLTMGYFGRTKLGRIISRITSDADAVRQGVQDVVFVGLVQGVQMIGAAAVMLYLDWRLFLLLLGLAPILYAINRRFQRQLTRAYRAIQESFSRVTSTLAESVTGIRVTQGFVREDVNAELFGELVSAHGDYNMLAAKTTGFFTPLLEFNSQVFYAGLVILGGYLVFYSENGAEGMRVHAEAMVGFFFMAGLFFGPIQVMGQLYNQALMAMAGAERVFGMLDTPPDWVDPAGAVALPAVKGKVEFEEVGFEYAAGRPVLQEVSFTAQAGETIALVGHTGSGKTTLIHLISKFYLPTQGRILLDGYDLGKVDTQSLHRQMGIVLQNNFLFTGTVMDNIRVGRPQASREEVIEAARKLDVLDLLEALPDELETQVGEGGRNMSLGQRQIICFARAMLADPRILILDEATSSVDAMTEARVQKSLAVLLQGRTSFVVAHRLSTIRQANQILVLDKGLIVERGTHTQLLATGGVYAHLYKRFIRGTQR